MRKFLFILNIVFILGLFIPQFTFAARLWSTGFELQYNDTIREDAD